MPRYRLSRPAEADLARVLVMSEQRWGTDARRRYAAILAAGMRKVAADPQGPTTRDRAELAPGLRSFHIRHSRAGELDAKVRNPVHVIFYRLVEPGLVEIARVLHERMEPARHLGSR